VLTLARKIATAARLLRDGRGDELRYRLWNRWKGIELGFVSVQDLNLPVDRAHGHGSSGGPALARVFEHVDIPPGSVIVDLGSGKGGAALTLSALGFEHVIGVELSPSLVEIARRNAARLRLGNVRFIQADAAAFHELDRVTHVYMFNPFPAEVMATVMANLRASLARVPRALTLVYVNPAYAAVVEECGLFESGAEGRLDEHVWRVYRARGG
jgi:SAM-dependent methyltransferase